MQISISARHGHLGEGTKEKITAKVERLARLFERLSAIDVTIDLEHEENPTVDIRVSAEHKHDFVACEQSTSLMAALDGAIHKLEHQLRKYKEKVQDHHRAAASKHDVPKHDVPNKDALLREAAPLEQEPLGDQVARGAIAQVSHIRFMIGR